MVRGRSCMYKPDDPGVSCIKESSDECADVVKGDGKVAALIRILLAIHKAGRLIVKEKDSKKLIKGICNTLIETGGYNHAWIVLIDEQQRKITAAESGLGDAFLPVLDYLKVGSLPECAKKALELSSIAEISPPCSSCGNCPLKSRCSGKSIICTPIEYGDHVYGLFALSMEQGLMFDPVEKSMFDGIARDIAFSLHGVTLESERRRAEEALRVANNKLNLLSGITRHDVLNQIMAITGYVALLEDMAEDDPTFKKYLNQIEKIAATIQNQINFTRDYQDMGVNAPEWHNLGSVVSEAAKTALPPSVELHVIGSEVEIFADPLLVRVFFNLMDNAVRHGGAVTEINVSFQRDGGKGIIACYDNGNGVPDDKKEVIFKRGVGSNTGLGLFLVREILAITCIEIRECGKEGRGARFEMILPAENVRELNPV